MFPTREELMGMEKSDEVEQKNREIGQEIFIGKGGFQGDKGVAVQQSAEDQQDDQIAVEIEPGKESGGYDGYGQVKM
jgi:hypothetical protein